MDERILLESALFAHLESTETTEELQAHPSLLGGINVKDGSGNMEYIIQPGVSTEGASLIDPVTGEIIAKIRKGVHGRIVYDMEGGETVVSTPDLFGSVLQDGNGELIGFTRPAFPGGTELQNSAHHKLLEMDSSSLMTNNFQSAEYTPIISGNTFDGANPAFDAMDAADSLNDASDALDVLDAMDVLGDLF